MSKIVIIDYGAGNLMSIKNMLRKVGSSDIKISGEASDVLNADKIILPGVGHFDYGMKKLKESGLIPVLDEKVNDKNISVLGICLGAQLMTKSSEEGHEAGLGWVNAKTVAFNKDNLPETYKIPHMGWNEVHPQKNIQMFDNMPEPARFYFVHSYHLKMHNQEDVWLTAKYPLGFCAAFHHKNIYGCQFHPEKSHKFGLQMMKNFIEL